VHAKKREIVDWFFLIVKCKMLDAMTCDTQRVSTSFKMLQKKIRCGCIPFSRFVTFFSFRHLISWLMTNRRANVVVMYSQPSQKVLTECQFITSRSFFCVRFVILQNELSDNFVASSHRMGWSRRPQQQLKLSIYLFSVDFYEKKRSHKQI
jgi:hypothetical protein